MASHTRRSTTRFAIPRDRTFVIRPLLLAALMGLLPTFGDAPGAQTTYQVVSDLGTSQGHSVDARLVRDSDGTLYGTATAGGTHNQGTVFRIETFGVLTTLHSFDGTNGGTPAGGVVMGPDGYLYGTTVSGGSNSAGTLYRVHAGSGSFEVLYNFGNVNPSTGQYEDGSAPMGGLVFLPDGMLYGTTTGGGANGAGTIYRMTTAGAITVLHTFTYDPTLGYYPGGFAPRTALVGGNDGNLYGTTENSGALGNGAIFRIDPVTGVFAVVHDFAGPDPITGKYPDGRSVQAALVVSPNGTLYGTAALGGANDVGTVFRLTPSGVFTVLRAFAAPGPQYQRLSGRLLSFRRSDAGARWHSVRDRAGWGCVLQRRYLQDRAIEHVQHRATVRSDESHDRNSAGRLDTGRWSHAR
jgi:uncharacterized repeat protein (TIGR03803 family)